MLCIATLVVSTVFYVVNIGLLGLLFTRLRAQPVLQTLRGTLVSTTVPFAIMASLAVILVGLWDHSPYLAIVLVGPLVAIALYQRRQHDTLDRLRELDRLKDEFIAITSHELRTPLASVYGAAMTLQRRELWDEQRESLLGVIYRESGRLARLVDQVLWASRLESARGRRRSGASTPSSSSTTSSQRSTRICRLRCRSPSQWTTPRRESPPTARR